jgi:hypothetical protein
MLIAAVLLAGCGSNSGSNETNAAENSAESVNTASPVAPANQTVANGAAQANEAAAANETGDSLGTLPPADAALRFVGTWAASKAECESKPWRFTADSLKATGGPTCSFYKVTKAPGGYDIAAQCPAKEPVHTDLINLRFAESARAMLVESNAIKPTGLIYCGK